MITEKIDKLYRSNKISRKLWEAWLGLCLILDGVELSEKDMQMIEEHLEEILNLTYNIKEDSEKWLRF
ncbi:MAG: hypothetical protein DRJ30_07670 [Candidatus Methanomethylicota archaeon]|nr:MAG: hypothetical protein DRJ30_07670 [Candidatus Verstraetearchaeota archaeon]